VSRKGLLKALRDPLRMALDHKDGPDRSTSSLCYGDASDGGTQRSTPVWAGGRGGGITAVCEKNGWSSSASAEISSRLGNDLSFVCSTCGTAMLVRRTSACGPVAPRGLTICARALRVALR
jgi:hypothetical protein